MPQRYGWSIPLRALLACIWIVHGLEKFGFKWPRWLAGGTHSVEGMFRFMMEETPISPLAAIFQVLFVPISRFLQIPVGILEIGIGLAIATGLLLPWAASVGLVMQVVFWLGFLSVEWPLQYPLMILAHLSLLVKRDDPRWLVVWRLALGGLWLYQSDGRTVLFLAIGGLLILGIGTRILSVIALALIAPAFQTEAWGSWPWVYYTVAVLHLVLLVRAHEQVGALSNLLPKRTRSFIA